MDTARMIKTLVLILTISLLFAGISGAAEIIGPDVSSFETEARVGLSVKLDDEFVQQISKGFQKEFTIYVDLFRRWDVWPDEFIRGVKIIRTIKADTVKGEFTATSFDGVTMIDKRFATFEQMMLWALTVKDVRIQLGDIGDRENHFVRVTVESRKQNLPKMIGYILFFTDSKDFKVFKDSAPFKK
jgi:dihydroorotase